MSDLDDLMSAFAGVNMNDHDELTETFARVLGADADQSRFFLEASSWNLEVAVSTFLDTVGSRTNLVISAPPTALFNSAEVVQQVSAHVFSPGQPIQLVWAFTNTGPNAWPMEAALHHCEGDRMGGSTQHPIGECHPGATASIHLELRAPPQNGSYASCWRLRYSGGYFSDPIWLMVNVGGDIPAASTTGAVAANMMGTTNSVQQASSLQAQQQLQQQQQQQQMLMQQSQQQHFFGTAAQPSQPSQQPGAQIFAAAAASSGLLGQPVANSLGDDDMDL